MDASRLMLRAGVIATAFAAFTAISQPASAVVTSCPGSAITTDREFSTDATPASTCLASGVGNINGQPGQDEFLDSFAGWMLVDKDDTGDAADGGLTITGLGTTSGTFSFTAEAGFKYALGLKSGEGQLNPDWAVFGLNGATSGLWAIDNSAATGNQSLSHGNLYKMATDVVIPLPASLPLLLGGLAGLGIITRRRRAA